MIVLLFCFSFSFLLMYKVISVLFLCYFYFLSSILCWCIAEFLVMVIDWLLRLWVAFISLIWCLLHHLYVNLLEWSGIVSVYMEIYDMSVCTHLHCIWPWGNLLYPGIYRPSYICFLCCSDVLGENRLGGTDQSKCRRVNSLQLEQMGCVNAITVLCVLLSDLLAHRVLWLNFSCLW